ncbi:MAG: nitroreductase [Candidatus Omnitrophota bacterium]
MNEIIKNIHERRSVRFFYQKPVPRDILQQVLDAGNAAPSGMNSQGWRFAVVESADNRRKLSAITLPKYKSWLAEADQSVKDRRAKVDAIVKDPVYYDAPVVIFVIGVGTVTQDNDCPMVCENMMLAARALGLGSCWVYFGLKALEEEPAREMLGLNNTEKAYGPLLMGYPKEGFFPPPPPKKPAAIKWL